MGVFDFPNLDPIQGSEVLPEGLYRVKITKHERVKGRAADQIRWYAQIVDAKVDLARLAEWASDKGVEASAEVLTGKGLLDHLSLSEPAQRRVAWFLKECLGVNTRDLPKMGDSSEVFERLLNLCDGREMWWDVIVSVYEGKTNNKVNAYMPILDQEPVDMGDLDDVPDFIRNKE